MSSGGSATQLYEVLHGAACEVSLIIHSVADGELAGTVCSWCSTRWQMEKLDAFLSSLLEVAVASDATIASRAALEF